MSHIFVSYHTDDLVYVRSLSLFLRDSGFDIWLDNRHEQTNAWDRTILRAIEDSSVFVAVMSPTAQAADNVLREVFLAAQWKKPVIGIRLAGKNWPIIPEKQTLSVSDLHSTLIAKLCDYLHPKQECGSDKTHLTKSTELHNQDLVHHFFQAYGERRWDDALAYLMRIQMGHTPMGFRWQAYEREVRAQLKTIRATTTQPDAVSNAANA